MEGSCGRRGAARPIREIMDTPERRRHKRHEVRCPIRLCGEDGYVLVQAHTANVSDGGAFCVTGLDGLPPVGAVAPVEFALPRTTPNTRMLEDVSCTARVVRHQMPVDGRLAGAGIQFAEPLDLMIEV